jgi:hypothetical protein
MLITKDKLIAKANSLLNQNLNKNIFIFQTILEARAEISKYFCSFFGSNENFKICF